MLKLSVILTVYNLESCITESLNSIGKQTIKPFELIIINDGSTDRSGEICELFAQKNSYTRVIHQENCGQAQARNKAIELISGDYLLCLDGDDLYEKDFFERMITLADRDNSDVICCRSDSFDHKSMKKYKNDFAIQERFIPFKRVFSPVDLRGATLLSFVGWAWDKLFKIELIKNNNINFPKLSNSEDLVFVYSAILFSKKISIEKKVLVHHRINREDSVSNKREEDIYAYYEAYKILKERVNEKNSEVWQREKWGAINWLTSYTYWALNSLKNKKLKNSCLDKIRKGYLEEYEFDKHPKEYYSLSKDGYEMIFDEDEYKPNDVSTELVSNDIKFSIIVPIYNAEKYIEQCLQSLQDQSYKNFEVLCINDGSTDSTRKILDAFAEKDARFKVINNKNSGYGYSINLGISKALGDYIGILESDDFASFNMLNDYANAIIKHDKPDFVKADFYLYWDKQVRKVQKMNIFNEKYCDQTINPLNQHPEFFLTQPAIWSAFYRSNFLKSNNIRCLESPGASYQDTTFNFLCWRLAQKAVLLNNAYVYYRQDNENSSINNKGKMLAICKEFENIKNALKINHIDDCVTISIFEKMMFDAYLWNYKRIDDSIKSDFFQVFQKTVLSDGFKESKFLTRFDKILILAISQSEEVFYKVVYNIALSRREKNMLFSSMLRKYGIKQMYILYRKRYRKYFI